MKLFYSVATTAGIFRTLNQDNFFINGSTKETTDTECLLAGISEEDSQLFAVCDGMGGESSGEIASALAVQTLQSYTFGKSGEKWSEYIKEVNKIICEYQKDHHIYMGTTFAGIHITPFRLSAINIGDSRIYRICDGSIRQLSIDHNEYQIILDAGIEMEEHAIKKAKCRLTQFLGLPEDEFELDPHILTMGAPISEDYYLICSDGLYDVLSDEQMVEIISGNEMGMEVGKICERLIKKAMEQGAKDNITVLLVYVFENN